MTLQCTTVNVGDRGTGARLGGMPYHSPKLHPGPCNGMGMRPRTDRQIDTQTRVTTTHFASSTTHAKCKNNTKKQQRQSLEVAVHVEWPKFKRIDRDKNA